MNSSRRLDCVACRGKAENPLIIGKFLLIILHVPVAEDGIGAAAEALAGNPAAVDRIAQIIRIQVQLLHPLQYPVNLRAGDVVEVAHILVAFLDGAGKGGEIPRLYAGISVEYALVLLDDAEQAAAGVLADDGKHLEAADDCVRLR